MSKKLKNLYLPVVTLTYCMFDNTWIVSGRLMYDFHDTTMTSLNREVAIRKLTCYTQLFCDKDGRFIKLKFNKAQYEKVKKIVESVVKCKVEIQLSYIYNPNSTIESL